MICSNYLLRQCARLSVLLILAMTPVFQSCSSDNIVEPELETGNALVEINSVVEILLERGFDLEDIVEFDKFYLVEDDMVFSKDIEDYMQHDSRTHYHYDNLLSNNYLGLNTINVFSELPFGPFDPSGNDWGIAVQQAINAWNAIPNSCITFQQVGNPAQAHIRIVDGSQLGLQQWQFGWAGQPSAAGAPFHTIWINLQYPVSAATPNGPIANTTAFQKRNIIAHELGHCIGFAHTDVNNGNAISGTLGTDPTSIMADNLNFLNNSTVISNMDQSALISLYGNAGNCMGSNNNPPLFNINLDPISVFCYPNTFSVSGDYFSGLLGATTVQLSLRELTGGLSAFQPIAQGNFTNGSFAFNDIDLDNIPGFTFNPGSDYIARATMTNLSQGPVHSGTRDLIYDECIIVCQNACDLQAPVIEFTGSPNFPNEPAYFCADQDIFNDPCSNNFTFEWRINGFNLVVSDDVCYETQHVNLVEVCLTIHYRHPITNEIQCSYTECVDTEPYW